MHINTEEPSARERFDMGVDEDRLNIKLAQLESDYYQRQGEIEDCLRKT
jgi:hypothetical protein